MARMSTIAQRAESLLDAAVVATTPVAGGDICTATRLRLSDGRSALVKTRPQAPPDFFPTEARGLQWLASAAGGVDVPEVLAVESDCLILQWVEPGKTTPEAADSFGRALAATHAAGAPCFGTESGEDGFIGSLPLPNRTAPTWPEFYATRRVLPYLKLARDRGNVSETDAAAVEGVVRRIVELAGPDEPPARLHGDLWSGNLMWTDEGAVLIDPAAHDGHRETDLALLALFDCAHLEEIYEGYQDQQPLGDDWRDRVALHQVHCLLVHVAVYGVGYRGETMRAVARYV